jgi:Flp pilus assembly protein TadG
MARSFGHPQFTRHRKFARRLTANRSGLAMIEFAFAAPLVLGMGMLGTDTASLVITHMLVSQIATQTADNVSRVGTANQVSVYQVIEADINETFVGAEKMGESIGIFTGGRLIVSSLQRNANGGQWIAWQRCRGAKVYNSSFGVQGNGATGTTFPGMGVTGRLITASPQTAVMFVEVAYDFKSITPMNIFNNQQIVYTAAFNVRDNRDLTGGPNANGLFPGNPVAPVARCNVYSAARPT